MDTKGLKAHLASLAEVRNVMSWINREISDEDTKHKFKKMMFWSFTLIVFQMAQPYITGLALNSLIAKNLNELLLSGITFGLCILFQKIAERHMAKAREWILGQIYRNQDKRITELFFEKSVGQHIQESTLSVSAVDKGRWKLLDLQARILFEGAPTVMQISISLIFLWFISWVSGMSMSSSLFGYLLYSIYLNHQVMVECEPIDKSMRALNRRRLSRMEMAPRVKISNQENREIKEMTEWFDRDLKSDRKFWFWLIDQASWRSAINILGFFATLTYAFYECWHGKLAYGSVYAIIAWANQVSQSMWRLSDIEHQINWNLPSVMTMIKTLSIKPDIIEVERPVSLDTHTPADIEVCSISYCYPQRDSETTPTEDESLQKEEAHTIKKVSFEIKKGEKVALIGPSGSGKSTIARLLYRAMDPTIGCIKFDGTDLRNLKLSTLMQSIGYIPQHGVVFDTTLRENLTYRLSEEDRSRYSDDDLWRIINEVHLNDGLKLEKGLDTMVGKHGLKLSGGQVQRLMIASAIIGDPWFMIIDEATSSLDSTTEKHVQKGLERALGPKVSAVIVAHRLSTIRDICNKYIVLKPAGDVVNGDSQIEMIGYSFEELYAKSETFKQLADDQDLKI